MPDGEVAGGLGRHLDHGVHLECRRVYIYICLCVYICICIYIYIYIHTHTYILYTAYV